MTQRYDYDAVVVGSGPNGLAAAVTLARAGQSVLVLEGHPTAGGGMRTLEFTLPGFRHDVCSAVHPLGVGSPFFRDLPLGDYGLEWVFPDLPLAHLLDDGPVLLHKSVEATAGGLGVDAEAYCRLYEPLVRDWQALIDQFLGPFRLPSRPILAARFGAKAVLPARTLAEAAFDAPRARALFAGLAAHITLPLDAVTTAAGGLLLGLLAHAIGWPVARGGSQAIADALAAYLRSLGGQIETGVWVRSLAELPPARAVLLDVTPKQVLQLAGDRLPARYRDQLEGYRYGQGSFKVDWALSEPVPWRHADVRRAGTLHIGGTLDEIAAGERDVWQGVHNARPFVLFAQPSLFDDRRAPAGRHTAWAYCHVPQGSKEDMTARIESQIERFAPGFRDCILGRHTISAAEYEVYNPNYVGGDINGGVQDWRQLFTRPVPRLNPYTTPLEDVFLCSSATPPGGGVHGMCGFHAARTALQRRLER
jgi:phytoene dehydrogenase-like protein